MLAVAGASQHRGLLQAGLQLGVIPVCSPESQPCLFYLLQRCLPSLNRLHTNVVATPPEAQSRATPFEK